MSTDTTTLKIQRTHPDARMPRYATPGAACFDLHALSVNGAYHIPSVITHGCPVLCGTGLAFEVPSGHVMLIFSRSGHGFRDGIRLANCVGVIDSDYRGEVLVKLTRDCTDADYEAPPVIRPGDRVAQAMLVPIPRLALVEVERLSTTERGTGGFGSTGA